MLAAPASAAAPAAAAAAAATTATAAGTRRRGGMLRLLWAVPATVALWVLYTALRFGPRRLVYWWKQLALHALIFVASAYGFALLVLNPFRDRANLVYHAAKLYSQLATRVTGVTVRVEGGEHLLCQPCVYMANHQSTLDVLVCSTVVPPRTVVIAKKSLFWIPLFGWFLAFSRNISVERGDHASAVQSMNRAARQLRADKVGVWIFPEGTRSRTDGELLPFKKGGFHLAMDAQVPIVPVIIANQKALYDSKTHVFRAGELLVKVLPPVPTEGLRTKEDLNKLLDSVQATMQSEVQKLIQ